jgi:hypothetical protein
MNIKLPVLFAITNAGIKDEAPNTLKDKNLCPKILNCMNSLTTRTSQKMILWKNK